MQLVLSSSLSSYENEAFLQKAETKEGKVKWNDIKKQKDVNDNEIHYYHPHFNDHDHPILSLSALNVDL